MLADDMGEATAATGVSSNETNYRKRKPLSHRCTRRFNLLDAELLGGPKWLIAFSGEIQHQAHTPVLACKPRETASSPDLATLGTERKGHCPRILGLFANESTVRWQNKIFREWNE